MRSGRALPSLIQRPANISVEVLSVQADSAEHPQCLGKDLVPDAISGHGDDGVAWHVRIRQKPKKGEGAGPRISPSVALRTPLS